MAELRLNSRKSPPQANQQGSGKYQAEIVVTHGGTGSIMLILYHGKIPLVMPRQKKYHEHVDDHQVLFCKTMESRQKIIAVYESEDLGTAIKNYAQSVRGLQKAASPGQGLEEKAGLFAAKLHDICLGLVNKERI